jgi:hypothetical protein
MRTGVITGKACQMMGCAEAKLCPLPESVRDARNFVREHLMDWGFPKGADDASLIANELASNAITAAPETPYWVTIWVANGWPMLEVADCSPEPPVLQPTDSHSESGRGLHIVDALSVAWDSYPVTGGKVIWVQLNPD